MRTLKSWLLPAAIAAGAAGLFSFYGINTATLNTPVPVSTGSNEYKFEVTNLAPLTGGINPNYRVVVYHDDGTFFMGTQAELAAHTYRYSQRTQAYHPAVEVIARYDDGSIPPKRVASLQDITVSTGGTVQLSSIPMGGKKILLQSTCSAVPGDSATYIVTYDLQGTCTLPNVSGKVTLKYNKGVFDYRGVDPNPYHGETEPLTATDIQGTNLQKVECTFSNLSTDKQRNIYFLLETKDGASLGADPTVSAELEVLGDVTPGTAACAQTHTDALTGQTVRESHDPNYKEIVSNDMCNSDGYIEWRIHFQNEGNAPEDSIWITDWIDPLLDYGNVQITGGHPAGIIIEQWKRPGERTYNCLVRNIHLRGLGERGVDEASTRGYVTLKTKKAIVRNCNAYVNRARIRFGYKPPIETADKYAFMPCSDGCDSCVTILDTSFAPRTINVGDTLFNTAAASTGLFSLLQSASYFKWYPTDGLSNWLILNPAITKNTRRTYTLVASFNDSCERVIIRMPVGPDCTLALSPKTTLPLGTDCNQPPNWDLTVTAIVPSSDHLMWHTGATGVNSYTKTGLDPGVIYVGVWDTLTGCSAEKWIRLADKCPKKNPYDPWGVVAIAALVVVVGFLLFKILTKK